MWVIIGLSIALANPERPFERVDDRLRQRHHAQLLGDGPVYGSKYGRIECQVFRDGMIQRYARPLSENKTEIRRFSAAGFPLTRLLTGADGPLSVKVYGEQEFLFDVEDWQEQLSHGLALQVPARPIIHSEGTHLWELDDGTLTIGSNEHVDPFTERFRLDFEGACRCTLIDRNTTWIQGHRSLRLRFSQATADHLRFGDLWVIPTEAKVITIQWIANGGGLFDRPLAKGRAIVALIEKVSTP
jgi:hypothetical protein